MRTLKLPTSIQPILAATTPARSNEYNLTSTQILAPPQTPHTACEQLPDGPLVYVTHFFKTMCIGSQCGAVIDSNIKIFS